MNHVMPSNIRVQVLGALTNDPQTPNDIARIVGHTQKTVQTILLEEANTNKRIRFKKVGRYRVFWIEFEKEDE